MWPSPGSWCSKGSLESPSGSETCQPRPGAAKAPSAPCSCGSGCGGVSPGAGCSALRDGAPSTETDPPLRPPWLGSVCPPSTSPVQISPLCSIVPSCMFTLEIEILKYQGVLSSPRWYLQRDESKELTSFASLLQSKQRASFRVLSTNDAWSKC